MSWLHAQETMVKKQKLGRGLDALLSSNTEVLQYGDELNNISLDALSRGQFQPRGEIDPATLTELTESIKSQGVIQPIIVRKITTGYEIIAGERRFKAAKLAGLKQIPAIIRPMSDEIALAIGLIENIQREALTPLEEAVGLNKLIKDFHMTHAKVSEVVGRSRSSVTNLIRLLQLSSEVKEMLNNGHIDMGHARALLPLEAEDQYAISQKVYLGKLSVRQTEALVKKQLAPEQPTQKITVLKQLSKDTSKKIGLQTKIKIKENEQGKIQISFNSKAELNAFLQKLH